MARPVRKAAAEAGGFTLVEMLVAIGILMFGVTSLIGLFGVGVSLRRTSELRNQAVLAVDQVLQQLGEEVLPRQTHDANGAPVPLDPVAFDAIEGHPGLRARVEFRYDEAFPRLVLASIDVTWTEEGALVGERFERVLTTYEGFSQRVERARSKR
jgi:hypothetical protein